jgi:hypothetical protein
MHWNDRWEKLWHSIPIGAMPGEPIGLQSAVKLIIERKSGIGAAEDRFPAISFQPEFMNMWYGGRFMNMWHGGSKLRADLEERSELARTEGIQTAARNWIKERLRTDKLRLLRDGGPPKVWVCESEFWQRVDPDDVFMQTSILDREGDEKGAYVLDKASLTALLEIDPSTHESEDAGYVVPHAPRIVVNRAEVVTNTAAPTPAKHESEDATHVGGSTSAPLGPARPKKRRGYMGALKGFIARKNPAFLSRIDADGLERQFRHECEKSGGPELPGRRALLTAIRQVHSQQPAPTTAGERSDKDG